MPNETSAPPFSPGHAPLRRSTVQHSRGLTRHGGCQLGQGHHTAVSVDTRESQYLKPFSARDVSISEAPQLPSSPSQILARSSGIVGHSSRELDVSSSLDNAVDQYRTSSIDPRLVDRTRDFRVTQDHASDYTMNHGNTLPPSYPSSLLLPHASRFEVPGNSFAAPTMGLGPIPSYDGTAGQVIDSNTPRSQLPNSVRPSLQAPHPRLPALSYASTHQSLTHIPSQSNSTSYSTPMPNQNSSSWSLREHPGYHSPVQPHSQQTYSTRPPAFHTGNQMELHAPSILDDYTAQGHSGHPSHTLSDHRSITCGWRDDEGNECGMLVHPRDCNNHFAAVHGITRMARDFEITCRWCHPERKVLRRHNFLRHMREVHLGCSRPKKGEEV